MGPFKIAAGALILPASTSLSGTPASMAVPSPQRSSQLSKIVMLCYFSAQTIMMLLVQILWHSSIA